MPCDTVTTIKVTESVEKWNAERTKEAIRESGMASQIQLVNGKLVSSARTKEQADAAIVAVRKKYAELTLKATAKRFGWIVNAQTTTKTGLTQLKLMRR